MSETIGQIDGDALMKWIEECDLVVHFKPELYIKLRNGDFKTDRRPSILVDGRWEKLERFVASRINLMKRDVVNEIQDYMNEL